LWHHTDLSNLDSIRQHGLLASKAHGDSGSGPNEESSGVWATTEKPSQQALMNTLHVEFHAHPNQISGRAESPPRPGVDPPAWGTPQEWASKRPRHVIMNGDVKPDQILGLHEPWHETARYMRDNGGHEDYKWMIDSGNPSGKPEIDDAIKAYHYLKGQGKTGSKVAIASSGHWDMSGEEPVWKQSRESLLQDALHDWVGSPTDMHREIAAHAAGEPLPLGANGTHRIKRARAAALHDEITQNGLHNTKPLYRGAPEPGLHPSVPTSWSQNQATAQGWAKKSGGTVHTLEPGQGHGIKMSDYIPSGVNDIEHQWLMVAPSPAHEAKVRNVSDDATDGDGITDSIMIAIVPPASVVENLALDEGESAKQLHVTLAYLGETSEYSEQLVGNLHEIVASWAEGQSKFTATVQGVGTFLPAEEDGQHVLWASIGAPGLHRVHTSLVDYLKGHGYDPRENHGFVAHLTLAYSPYHFRFMPKVKRQEFRVHEIWCCIAGRWESITLKGDVRN
jgi:2'-5' RNA ligase